MTKSAGQGDELPGGDQHAGGRGSSVPSGLGDGSGRYSVDTGRLKRGADGFESAADRLVHFGNGNRELASYAPVPSGEGDESWNTFAPKYYKRSEEYLSGVGSLAKVIRLIAASVNKFALFCEGVEANNTHVAKSALNLNGAPDPGAVPGRQPGGNGGNDGRR